MSEAPGASGVDEEYGSLDQELHMLLYSSAIDLSSATLDFVAIRFWASSARARHVVASCQRIVKRCWCWPICAAAIRTARRKAFVILDGTLVGTTSPPPVSTCWALYPAASRGLPTLADDGYDATGIGAPVPDPNSTYNALLRGLRSLGERGFALLIGGGAPWGHHHHRQPP